MKKLSVNSPEYRDLVSKLLSKEVKFENLPVVPIPQSPVSSTVKTLPRVSSLSSLSLSPFKSVIQKATSPEPKSPSISPTKKGFTEHKDTDALILMTLDDESLFKACQSSTYISNLCDETFWRNRLIQKFSESKVKRKPEYMNFKQFYIKNMQDKLGLGWNLYYSPDAPTVFSYYIARVKKRDNDVLMGFDVKIPNDAPNMNVFAIYEKGTRKLLLREFFHTIKQAQDYFDRKKLGNKYKIQKLSTKIFFHAMK